MNSLIQFIVVGGDDVVGDVAVVAGDVFIVVAGGVASAVADDVIIVAVLDIVGVVVVGDIAFACW